MLKLKNGKTRIFPTKNQFLGIFFEKEAIYWENQLLKKVRYQSKN